MSALHDIFNDIQEHALETAPAYIDRVVLEAEVPIDTLPGGTTHSR